VACQIHIRGAVQGVGFRPFVYRLAAELGIRGDVRNTADGVIIRAAAEPAVLDAFQERLRSEAPPLARVQEVAVASVPEGTAVDPDGFTILASGEGEKTTAVLPDACVCGDCLRELFDPADRRHRYPFINCTHCGPRFSIIEALPYDRANTTMKTFDMCPACGAEYEDPGDRRFHAQPNACPKCGPQLALWDCEGQALASRDEALRSAAQYIRAGDIVAVKGLGGFHLVVDACQDEAVGALRRRKQRDEKPFALMFRDISGIRGCCEVSERERDLLTSPEAPIVLLDRLAEAPRTISDEVAPGNPSLGVMLPYTPLHHLLLAELEGPVVATSANLSEEPICTDEHEAVTRLKDIADAFLVHNRPIARHVDDSVVRVVLDRELILRRARGYAPLPVTVQGELPRALAVGAHLKNTVAISVGNNIFVSQHIGDLEAEPAYDAFRRVVADFETLYDHEPEVVARDLHPDYMSTRFAELRAVDVRPVQHHLAHVLACLADNDVDAPCLGVSWDGTGYGPDAAVWGGECFVVKGSRARRVATLRRFPLPGGEQAVKEPRRSAIGMLYAVHGAELFDRDDLAPLRACSPEERRIIARMLARGLNSPLTSSVGRVFDAVASLLDLRHRIRFEGQAAMMLEYAAAGVATEESYPVELGKEVTSAGETLSFDWEQMLTGIVTDLAAGVPGEHIAARAHNTFVETIVAVAREADESRVVLTGGCFQNRYLVERAVTRLREEGFEPLWHRQVPPNDGGIAVGQIMAAARGMGELEC